MALIPTTQVNVSPDDYKRKIAFALMQQGMDTSPVQAWTQGAARALQGALGGYEMYQDDQKQKADEAGATKAYLDFLKPGAGASTADAAMPGTAPQTAPTGAPAGYGNAISALESGGKYDALGPVTKTGDRAYGKYQVMGANIPQWSKEVLGQELTPQAFAASPEAQDKIFNAKFGQYANKYGPEGAARAWFAGEGGMNNPNARDQLGTSVAQYGKNFTNAMGRPVVQALAGVPPDDQPDDQPASAPYQVAGQSTAAPGQSPTVTALANNPAPQAAADDPAKAQIAAMLQSPNPQTRKMGQTLASSYITSKMTADNTPISVGGKLVTKTGKVIYDGGEDKKTPAELDFEYGQKNPAFRDYQQATKTPLVNIDNKAEGAFKTKAAQLQAERYDGLAAEAPAAKQMLSDVSTLTELGKNIQTGKLAEAKAAIGPYAQALGVDVKGLDETQAFEAIVNRVAPSLRVKGSGAQSDFELKNFLKSLPALGNTEGGNAIASKTMQGLYQNKLAAAEIGSKALNGEITPSEADKQLRELPDHMADYREYLKAHPAGKSAPDISALKQKYGLQ